MPCCPHIETSQLVCTANQLTSFYLRATLALNGLTLRARTLLKNLWRNSGNFVVLVCWQHETKTFRRQKSTVALFTQNLVSNGMSLLPAGNYMFKVNNRNTRTRCEICSKLTIKIPERRQWRHSVSIVNFEQVNAGWACSFLKE